MSHGLRFATLIAIAVAASYVPVRAATIEVSVEERGAGPVPDQTVALYLVTPNNQIDPLFLAITRPVGRCTTGPTGRCRFADLAVGVYLPYLPSIADPNLVTPTGPPMVAYGTLTIAKPDASSSFRIVLQRGARIQFKVVSDDAAVPSGSRVELGNDSAERADARLDASGRGQITLGSGRWVAHLANPSGARVVRVELDGRELQTLDVPIEILAPSSDRFVTWTLSPPCRVGGVVTTNTGEPPRVAIEATLVAPGSWSTSALCRATNCAPPQRVGVDRKGRFEIELPSGIWRIAPTGESLLESSPPFREVSCEEGKDVRADFDIRETASGGPKAVLVVRVLGDNDRPVPAVPVEVWPSTGKLEAAPPIATETTDRFMGFALFEKLAAGSYLLRARSPGYRIAVLPLPNFDPEERNGPRDVTIRLDRGATIDALATDEKDRPVSGVGLGVKRTDVPKAADDPAASLEEPDVEIAVPPSKDQSGHVVVTGLSGGTYDVTPVLSGAAASTATISISVAEGTADKSVVLRLAEHDLEEVSVRVRPAPALAGTLLCADGGLLPHQADACVLGLSTEDEDGATRDSCKHALIPSTSVTLTGDRHDAFLVGPLTAGSFRLGLRPRGYTEWTWALGTSDGEQAAVVQVNGNDAVDLGAIPVLCGPAVELRPTVVSRDPLPDLTVAVVAAELTRPSAKGKLERRVVPAERDHDRVVLRELPEGEWTLDVTMSHPFFVPPMPLHLSVPVKLERGVHIPTRVEIVSIGGAVMIEEPAGSARLTGPDGTTRIESAKEGRIAIDGVSPGAYRVELCEDDACARVLRRWDRVTLTRGKQVALTTSPQPDTSASSPDPSAPAR